MEQLDLQMIHTKKTRNGENDLNGKVAFMVAIKKCRYKIMGIGLVRNYINPKYKMCIYKSDTNYNRYVYNSAHRKDRSEINKKLLCALELILFKGSGHFKRGQGITTIPWKRFGKSGSDIYKLFKGLF